MVQLQAICKVINEGDLSFLTKNGFGKDYFFEFPDEYDFIVSHAKEYGTVPDVATFLGRFPDFELIDVRESESYLRDKLREESAFHRSVPIIEKAYSMLEGNAFEAINYLESKLPDLLRDSKRGAVDLVGESGIRGDALELRMSSADRSLIPTGFAELDRLIGGWDENGELLAVIARPGVGKTWVLMAFLTAAWRKGYRVGLYSGEMPANEIGYRFDTLLTHVSNSDLYRGTLIKGVDAYKRHLESLREGGYAPFYVITQEELGGRPTVTDLENFAKAHGLDVLGVDQYTLMRDERANRGTEPRQELEHISADMRMMALRNRLAVLAVNQSNRNGKAVKGKTCPDLEDIYGSDAIAQNSTKVLSIGQATRNSLTMSLKKNRSGDVGEPITYLWDVDHGTFTYQPNADDPADAEAMRRARDRYGDSGDVF